MADQSLWQMISSAPLSIDLVLLGMIVEIGIGAQTENDDVIMWGGLLVVSGCLLALFGF